MKTIGKILVSFLVTVVALLAVLFFARNIIVKAAAETVTPIVLGTPLKLQKVDINFGKTYVNLEGIVLKNPDGFHGTELVNIPKILVDYNLSDILRKNYHLEDLEFDMRQFTVVKNDKGVLNLDHFIKEQQGDKKQTTTAPETKKSEPQKSAETLNVQIDRFRLKVGKVVYIDYSSGKADSKEFLINLDETYQNITDFKKLGALIVFKIMTKSSLANLANFDVSSLGNSVVGIAGGATKLVGQAATTATDTAKNVVATVTNVQDTAKQTKESASAAVKDVTTGVKDAADSLKGLFSKK